jgi:hypothetical protein
VIVIEDTVEDQVDEMVKDQALWHEDQLPPDLWQLISRHTCHKDCKMKLRGIKDSWRRHLGESCYKKALLKASEHGKALRTIYKIDGESSPHFLKALTDMSKLDGAFEYLRMARLALG